MSDVLLCVAPKNAAEIWPHVEPLIEAAFASGLGDDDLQTAKADVLAKRALLWVVWDGKQFVAAATTKIVETPTKRICVVTACGGRDMRRWIGFLDNIERYAKTEGCEVVDAMGRPGWKAVLCERGYYEPYVHLRKELT